ncbi:BZ3501_MvSof-1269-A2-R1_Chr12-1g03384 [Microbotryum saponariae]|nr:BZ3501_MvSof-1269-A2-R1_Chr12-1g03384 [Microbotryum saponariae]
MCTVRQSVHILLAAAVLMFHRPSRVSPMHDARRSQPESRRYGLPRSSTLDIADRFPLVSAVQHSPSQSLDGPLGVRFCPLSLGCAAAASPGRVFTASRLLDRGALCYVVLPRNLPKRSAKPSPSCLAPACSTHARAPPPPRRDSGYLPSSLAEPMPPLSHQQLAAAVLMFHRPSRVSPMHDARRSQPESRRYGLPHSPTLDIVDRFPLVAVVQHDPSQHPNDPLGVCP